MQARLLVQSCLSLCRAYSLLGRGTGQDKPWAIFGTCLGAIVAYEVTKRVAERKNAPLPIAIFAAAVSPPHLYAIAVMKLYVEFAVGAHPPDGFAVPTTQDAA